MDSTVVLVPAPQLRENPKLFFTAVTDYEGVFAMPQVPPGEYEVYAWEYAPANAYKNAQWRKPYEARAEKVRLDRGANMQVNLRMIPKPKQ